MVPPSAAQSAAVVEVPWPGETARSRRLIAVDWQQDRGVFAGEDPSGQRVGCDSGDVVIGEELNRVGQDAWVQSARSWLRSPAVSQCICPVRTHQNVACHHVDTGGRDRNVPGRRR